MVTSGWGKPYGLQNQVRRCRSLGTERAARPSLLGRLLEPVGDRRPREMTVAPQGEQNPAYHSHRFFFTIFYAIGRFLKNNAYLRTKFL